MMNVSTPEALQLAAGLAGAFLGGLLLVWRIRLQLPTLARQALKALRDVIADEARHVVMEEIERPLQRLAAVEDQADDTQARVAVLETNVQQVRRHVGLPSALPAQPTTR
ncbi:hypothetical protein [Hyalangium sp.]|uniref:hypothetical protein n=1 Tax=Hyalangium sp. TaxID=2028555 RepID=UPI002D35F4C4|nr:hypothetical protein [Hyalangium sp.]HYI00573.1 hypothetical protein [Hyalangium sp.]